MSDIFDKHFITSYEIIECYDLLASLLYSKECDKYVDDIMIILDNLNGTRIISWYNEHKRACVSES